MGLFDKWHQKWLEKRGLSLNEDDERILDWFGIPAENRSLRGSNSLRVAVVFACIKILSESISKLPIKIYKDDVSGVQVATNHYLSPLLKLRPNPHMTTTNFFSVMETQCNLYGNAYAHIEFGRDGKVKGLYPLTSTNVKVMVDDVGILNSKTKLWYEVTSGDKIYKLKSTDILHFKSSITLDGIIGVSPLDHLRMTISNAYASQEFINNFYKKGLQAKGLIQYTGDISEAGKKKFKEEFESMSSGLNNSHRIAMLPFGYQFTPISLKMTDAQFLENTELTIKQIATVFGIKMHQINDLSKSTHTNIEQQQQQFYADTTQVKLTSYEQEMTYKLFLDNEIESGYYSKFNIDAVLRADLETRYKAYAIGVNNGFLKPNEARAKEDMSPEPSGNRLIANGNMIPIDMVGKQYLKGGDDSGKEGTTNSD